MKVWDDSASPEAARISRDQWADRPYAIVSTACEVIALSSNNPLRASDYSPEQRSVETLEHLSDVGRVLQASLLGDKLFPCFCDILKAPPNLAVEDCPIMRLANRACLSGSGSHLEFGIRNPVFASERQQSGLRRTYSVFMVEGVPVPEEASASPSARKAILTSFRDLLGFSASFSTRSGDQTTLHDGSVKLVDKRKKLAEIRVSVRHSDLPKLYQDVCSALQRFERDLVSQKQTFDKAISEAVGRLLKTLSEVIADKLIYGLFAKHIKGVFLDESGGAVRLSPQLRASQLTDSICDGFLFAHFLLGLVSTVVGSNGGAWREKLEPTKVERKRQEANKDWQSFIAEHAAVLPDQTALSFADKGLRLNIRAWLSYLKEHDPIHDDEHPRFLVFFKGELRARAEVREEALTRFCAEAKEASPSRSDIFVVDIRDSAHSVPPSR